MIADVRSQGNQGGILTSQTSTGLANQGYGIIRSGKDSVDAARTNLSLDGYSNLEMYLDELAGDPVKYAATAITDPALRGSYGAAISGRTLRIFCPVATTARIVALDLSGHKIQSVFQGRLAAGSNLLLLPLSLRIGFHLLLLRTPNNETVLPVATIR